MIDNERLDAQQASDELAAVAPESSVPILIVDGNAAKRLALKTVLQLLGYPIVEADSGLAALRCIVTGLKEADEALYRANALGRNGVEHAALQPAA